MRNDKPEDLRNDKPEDLRNDKPEDLRNDKPEDLRNDKPEDLRNDKPEYLQSELLLLINSDAINTDTCTMTAKDKHEFDEHVENVDLSIYYVYMYLLGFTSSPGA